MRAILPLVLAATLAACSTAPPPRPAGPAPTPAPAPSRAPSDGSFGDIVRRVEPVAEEICRGSTRNVDCDFRILLDTRPGVPANAFQTVDQRGRPILVVTEPLLDEMLNADEIAFVLGHEAAHHIRGHIPQNQQNAVTGAVLAGVLAAAAGGNQATVREAQELGAFVGQRRYSKEFELEADALGTVIAAAAGYDPVRGAQYFTRSADPGDRFLGSHPPNADRIDIVRQTAAGLGG